jgi:hypothetical protein
VSPDPFWQAYDAMLARIRAERPQDIRTLFDILRDVAPEPSAGEAFALEGGSLMLALVDAGWLMYGIEGDYLWEARSPTGPPPLPSRGEWIHYVEGDVYRGRYRT